MKTLLLAHRETSSFFLTALIVTLIALVCGDFYKSTHHFSQKGNAPITLKILPKMQKPTTQPPAPKKPQPKVTKATRPKKAPKPTTQKQIKQENAPQKAQAIQQTQEVQKQEVQKQESTQAQDTPKPQESEISTESQESIELIASVQGEHFELYEKVHSALLKNVFYPKRARYKRLSGIVILEFVLEKNGEISQERVIQSSGYALLDESALKALSNTQFPTTPKRYRFRVPLRYG